MNAPLRSRLFRQLTLLLWAGLLLAAPRAAAQAVRGDITSIGFEARGSQLNMVREGAWFPIVAKLNVGGTEHFQGRFVCERVDMDGDRVGYTEPQVAVTGNGQDRFLWLYASTIKEDGNGNLDLIAFDQNNIAIPIDSKARPNLIGADAEIVLDISSTPLDGFRPFDANRDLMSLSGSWGRQYYRPVCIAALPSKSLPDRWIGLEAVNTIIWDEPDPDAISPYQVAALIQWVRAGGKLVLGVGPSWQKLQKSALREILPIQGDSPPQTTAYLPAFLKRYVVGGKPEDFKNPISVVVADLAPDSVVAVRDVLAENPAQVVNMVAMRWVGSGRVTTVAARLTDLNAINASRDFFRELIDLCAVPDKYKTTEESKANSLVRVSVELQPAIVRPTEFSRIATTRMLVAFAFVGVYILLATIASWTWLGRHKLTQLSWSVFAGFAIVASAIGIIAVFFLRGATDRVASVSVVDMQAETMQNTGRQARARVWFGYKSWIQQKVDLSLPGDNNYLRPMTSGPNLASAYATPERYAAVPGRALLKDAPMRATLKQFQGYWEGELDGGVRVDLTADRSSGRIKPESWIRCDLPADISRGYLLYIDPRVQALDGPPVRLAGLETTSYKGERIAGRNVAKERGAAAINVLCCPLPALKRGAQLTEIGREQNAKLAELERVSDEVERERREIVERTLWARQNFDWVESLRPGFTSGALDATSAALVLASTRSLYLPNGTSSSFNFEDVGWAATTDGLSELDVTHWLTRGQAVLLLLSDGPGPASLHAADKPLVAQEGRTLYRVRVPINYSGAPPR